MLKSSTVIPGSYAAGGGKICSLNLCQSKGGHILSAGWVRPVDFPIAPGVYDETQNGHSDTYIMKMDKDLAEVLLSTFIGGSRSERWNRMTTDGDGKIYLACYTLSSDFPTTKDAAFTEFGDVVSDEEENLDTSPRDAFIIKIDENLSAEVFEEIHDAAKRNRVNKLKELLSKNTNGLEKRDKYRRTPLHSAARYGASSAVQFLLDRGADVNAKDEGENTPLHLASLYGNPESIKFLLAGGANISVGDADGNTPIHIAALYRNGENLAELLKVNPVIDTANEEGHTPLLLAVRLSDNERAVGLLLQRGPDIRITDSAGRNALLVSVDSNQKEYINLLVSKGIDINSRDNEGNTALHYLFNKVLANKLSIPMCKEMARPLLEEGADPHIRNKEEKSVMDLAAESGEIALIDLLKSSMSMIRLDE